MGVLDKEVLFIGNGPNNLKIGINKDQKNVEWKTILKEINKEFKFGLDGYLESTGEYKNQLFTLIYECFIVKSKNAQYRSKKTTEVAIRERFNKDVRKLRPNKYHNELMKIGMSNIITTNYDFCLEYTEEKKGILNQEIKKNRNTTLLRYKTNNTRVWHIHGDCEHGPNMVLGNQEYGRNISRMQKNIDAYCQKEIENYESIKDDIYLNSIKGKNKVDNVMDFFFTHNIHILGLSLDFNEQDLWWLLIKRAKNLDKLDNKIFYYIPDFEYDSEKQKLTLFNEFGIKVIKINTNTNTSEDKYIRFYNSLLKYLNDIKEEKEMIFNEVAASKRIS